MQLPNMQPMPQSNQTPSPAPMGGLQTIVPQSAAPQMNTPAPATQSPYPAPPTAPFASSGAPPSSINPSAQPPVVQQLSQQGRYGDSTLVHMNPEEVGGLQALAQSQGGSLTVNPQTGLPEAFSLGKFLKGLLPTVLGAGLSMIPGVGPLAAAGITAAGRVATGGSLAEGLQAGLGAYGGAGLGQSLAHAGGAAAGQATGMSALKDMGSGLKNTFTGPLRGTPAVPGATRGMTNDEYMTMTSGEPNYNVAPAPAAPAGGYNPSSGYGPTGITSNPATLAALEPPVATPATAGTSATPGLWDRLKGVYGGARTAMAPPGSFLGNHPNIAKYAIDAGLGAAGTGILSSLAALGAPGGGGGGGKNKEKYPYRGPYYPTEREYIPDDRDYSDTSEHLFFDPVAPMPSYYREPAVAPKKRNPFGFAAGGMTSSAAPSVFGASQTGTTSYGGQGGGQSAGRDEALALYNQIMAANAAKAATPRGLAALPPPAAAAPAAPPPVTLGATPAPSEEASPANSGYGSGSGSGSGSGFNFDSGSAPDPDTFGFRGPSFADPMEYGMSMDSFPMSGRSRDAFDNFEFDNFEFDNGTGIGGGPPATVQDSGSGPDIPPFGNDGEADYPAYVPFDPRGYPHQPGTFDAAPGRFDQFGNFVNRATSGIGGLLNHVPGSGYLRRAAQNHPYLARAAGAALGGIPGYMLADDISKPRGNAEGGMRLEDGAFIVDARTVSEMGNGSSRAGQDLLAKHGGKSIHGKGDGVSDSIRASIGGKQDARVARDEVKFSPQAVAKLGGGDRKRGTQKLYAMMDRAANARKNAKRGEDTKLRGLLGA